MLHSCPFRLFVWVCKRTRQIFSVAGVIVSFRPIVRRKLRGRQRLDGPLHGPPQDGLLD